MKIYLIFLFDQQLCSPGRTGKLTLQIAKLLGEQIAMFCIYGVYTVTKWEFLPSGSVRASTLTASLQNPRGCG